MKILLNEKRTRLTDGTLLIVHGIITTAEGTAGAHGWIELDGQDVVDSGILDGKKITYRLPIAEFYANTKARDVTKYTPMQAYGTEKAHGHYGPWEKRYRILCPDL